MKLESSPEDLKLATNKLVTRSSTVSVVDLLFRDKLILDDFKGSTSSEGLLVGNDVSSMLDTGSMVGVSVGVVRCTRDPVSPDTEKPCNKDVIDEIPGSDE
jgi:hypothetical protein